MEENQQIAPLVLLGIEELAKDVAVTELPVVIKYIQGRIAYWQSQGSTLHWLRITLLKEELAAMEAILAELR